MNLKVDLSKLKNVNLSLKPFKKKFDQKKKNNRSKLPAFNVSKRDSILLGLLILGLEGYGLYNVLLSPKWQAYSSSKMRVATEETVATNFEKDMAKKNQYLENAKLLDYKLDVLTQEIPAEIPQEEIVIMLNKLAVDRKLDISGLSLSTISMVSKQDFVAGKTSSAQTQAASKVITPDSLANGGSPDNKNNQPNKPKLAGNMVLSEDVDIAFSGNYGALYNFINDLEKSDRKIIVKEVSMNRGDGSIIKGDLKVQFVGYVTPEDQSTYSLDTPQINGKISPFLAYPGYEDKVAASTVSTPTSGPGPAPVKTSTPDFYLLLNTYDDNAPKIIMGDSMRDGTELYSNTNASVRGKLAISGKQDNMTYSYSLGGLTQTKNAKLIMDGGKLRLEVLSLPRKNAQDKVSLTLDVDNKTNFPLEITVINDDKQAPRFNLGTKLGSVTVK